MGGPTTYDPLPPLAFLLPHVFFPPNTYTETKPKRPLEQRFVPRRGAFFSAAPKVVVVASQAVPPGTVAARSNNTKQASSSSLPPHPSNPPLCLTMGQGSSKAPLPPSATPTPPPSTPPAASASPAPAPPTTTRKAAAPATSSDTKGATSTKKVPTPRQAAAAAEHHQHNNESQTSLARKLTIYADETKTQLTRKMTIMAEETHAALERNDTVVSMASTGVHIITDAGIHLPHELHLPKTGLSHPLNAALGASTAAIVAASIVSPMMTVIDLAIIKSQFEKIGVGKAVKQTAGDLFAGRAKWFPATKYMGGVYLSTYMAANGMEAYCTVRREGGREGGRKVFLRCCGVGCRNTYAHICSLPSLPPSLPFRRKVASTMKSPRPSPPLLPTSLVSL